MSSSFSSSFNPNSTITNPNFSSSLFPYLNPSSYLLSPLNSLYSYPSNNLPQKYSSPLSSFNNYSNNISNNNISSNGVSSSFSLTTKQPLNEINIMYQEAVDDIFAYCKLEHIIPRESVFKHRIKHSKWNNMFNSSIFIDTVKTNLTHSTSVVGISPNRILWPRSSNGSINVFPCVDFLNPFQMFNLDQVKEVEQFLHQNPSCLVKGRYGLASFLNKRGPIFLRECKLGILLALVELLFNQNKLIYYKGKIIFPSLSTTTKTIIAPSLPSSVSLLSSLSENNVKELKKSLFNPSFTKTFSTIPNHFDCVGSLKSVFPLSYPPSHQRSESASLFSSSSPRSSSRSFNLIHSKIISLLELLNLKDKYLGMFIQQDVSLEVFKYLCESAIPLKYGSSKMVFSILEFYELMNVDDQDVLIQFVRLLLKQNLL